MFVSVTAPTSMLLAVFGLTIWAARAWMYQQSLAVLFLTSMVLVVMTWAVPFYTFRDTPAVISFPTGASFFLGINVG